MRLVALIAAFVTLVLATAPTATAQPLPPNRYYGSVTLNGQTPPVGTPVTAYIGEQLCGTGEVRADGRYVVDVDDATKTPGCGTPGAVITFRVGGVLAGQTGTFQAGSFTELPLTAPGQPAARRYTEAFLDLSDPRPCIPEPGQRTCDATRTALWNGDAAAWAARGVTDPDARFNETVVFRVRAGDPAAISNIARFLGSPYLKITRLHFGGGTDTEFIEITNLGGGDQDMTGWTVRSPDAGVVVAFPAGLVMNPGQSCRFYTGVTRFDSCGDAMMPAGDVWPDCGGRAVLFYDALALPGDDTLYNADPNNQPPPPNLQGVS